MVYWSVAIFFAISLFFALFSPAEYSSSASIIPEYELQDNVNEALESYGLLFGLTGVGRENRPPSYLLQLYPHMVNSVAFKKELMHQPFNYSGVDSTLTMFQYFTEVYQPSIFHRMYQYTIGLPGSILGGDKSQPEPVQTKAQAADDSSKTTPQLAVSILKLSPSERNVISELSSRITATYQRRTGIVQISASMPESMLAAQLVKLTLETLYNRASSYKTEKAVLYKNFLETQLQKAGQELETSRQALSEQSTDNNTGLQSRYESNLERYHTLRQQVQRMELNIQEQLPPFRLLDDITMPSTLIQPNRKLIVFLGTILGLFIGISWITASFILRKED
ncbi:GNVR domain-containing protein [Fodinibius sediminis]|uniref:G-rich domain on putative tyrosine kinase n=1 Tax=Fodinibius sediminis TaxID=1214077 RepID=A0A521DB03_9BACT|nr:GNVR domain-containing protein [Fodinibius sediminis]SMO68060.1 G-rich domain on putative tyrosine kinase [Fodinibius sediminis]